MTEGQLYRKLMDQIRQGCCAGNRMPCAVHSSYAAGVVAALKETVPALNAAQELIRSLGVEMMQPQMDGSHQCVVRANCSKLTVEQWQIIAQAEGQM